MKLLVALCALALCALAAATEIPNPGPGGMGCSLKMEKKDCFNSKDCLWCEGMFGATCYSKDQAKFLPGQMFKCKKPKTDDSVKGANPEPGPTPGPPPMCTDAKEKKDCKDIVGCTWCEASFGPGPAMGSCYDEAHAKWLPAQFYKCKPKPKAGGVAAA